MFFWNCEARGLADYLLLVVGASFWCYAVYCLIALRYERRSPLPWWEPVPFANTDLTMPGREYLRRFFFAFVGGVCAMLLAVALCSTR
jgi:hypothetical protein